MIDDSPSPDFDEATARTAFRRRLARLAGLAVISVAVAIGAWTLRSDDPGEPEVVDLTSAIADSTSSGNPHGTIAPVFSVPLIDGGSFDLASHLSDDGRPVFLNLWASWCGPCRKEMPAIEEASLRHPGIRFVGVAVQDDPVAAEDFAREIGVTYDVGVDERDRVDTLYPAFGLPVTYFISGDGIILNRIFGEIDGERIDAEIATWFGG